MWIMIVLLWLTPLALGIVALARIGRGESVLREAERRFLFGNSSEVRLSIWLGIKLALVSLLLFLAGIFQGLVVSNFDSFWRVLIPLVTAVCAILILALWLRSGSSKESSADQDVPTDGHQRATAAHRLDGFEL
jgi:hypothetical protein